MNPNAELPESVDLALTLNGIAELQRKKLYDESIAKLEELIGDDPADSTSADINTDEVKTSIEDDVTESFSETNKSESASESPKIKVLRHYLVCLRFDKEKSIMMKEKQSDPAMIELAEQIKQEIRAMIEAWDLNGAEDALNRIAEIMPFDPDIEDIRDEIIDRKINYMNYM